MAVTLYVEKNSPLLETPKSKPTVLNSIQKRVSKNSTIYLIRESHESKTSSVLSLFKNTISDIKASC